MAASISITTSYNSLVNEVAYLLYGLRPSSGDDTTNVIDGSVVTVNQAQDMLRAISKGMRSVYYPGKYVWSFLRTILYIDTVAPYTTGTVIIDLSGNVTLAGGTFPSNTASAFGQISIVAPVAPSFNGGTWMVGTYNSGSSVQLTNYTGPLQPYSIASGSAGTTDVTGTTFTFDGATTAAVGQYVIVYAATGSPTIGAYQISQVISPTQVLLATSPGTSLSAATWSLSASSGVTYTLFFNHYVLPSTIDGFEENLTFTGDGTRRDHTLEKVDELQIRHRLQRDYIPRRPEMYAITTSNYVQTSLPASTRYVTLFPAPHAVYTLYGKAIVRPLPLDSTNCYPIGDEILGGVFTEACLAAAERDVQQMDASHPDAVHNRAFLPLLASAIEQDKRRAAPDTLGVMGSGSRHHDHGRHWRGGEIHLIGGFGGQPDSWIP